MPAESRIRLFPISPNPPTAQQALNQSAFIDFAGEVEDILDEELENSSKHRAQRERNLLRAKRERAQQLEAARQAFHRRGEEISRQMAMERWHHQREESRRQRRAFRKALHKALKCGELRAPTTEELDRVLRIVDEMESEGGSEDSDAELIALAREMRQLEIEWGYGHDESLPEWY